MRDEILRLRLFGERLRELRVERDLSQEALAELAGLDRNSIGRIERAERNVALVNNVRIAKALEIEPAALFEGFAGGRVGEVAVIVGPVRRETKHRRSRHQKRHKA